MALSAIKVPSPRRERRPEWSRTIATTVALMSADPPRYEDLIGLWQEGQRRLATLEPATRASSERIVDAIVDELHRRLGGRFSVQELTDLAIRDGTDWCFDIAVRVAPHVPEAWDLTTVAGAALARYAREASDYPTGRRLVEPTDT